MSVLLAVAIVSAILSPPSDPLLAAVKDEHQRELVQAAHHHPARQPEPHVHRSVLAAVPPTSAAADAVAACESGQRLADGTAVPGSYSLTITNPTSGASGKYQFLDSTWTSTTGLPAPASAHPEHVQDAAFHTLWQGGAGSSHWNASRSCWEAML